MCFRIFLLWSMAVVMLGCDMNKEKKAQATIDSLQSVVNENKKLTTAMVEIGALLDSIDANRHVLRTRMLEGTNYEVYKRRMSEINRYVRATERKIAALEKSRKRSASDAAYAAAIRRLRSDLDTRNNELAALQEKVEKYKNDNDNLVNLVSIQKAEILDNLNQLKAKKEESAVMEAQVQQLMVQQKIDEGEAYFARAAAVEETANRTHFAPKKKKSTQKEALELYRMALFYGKEEAQTRIAALEKNF